MERVLGIVSTASQAVTHVLLRDLTNYYHYKEVTEHKQLNMLALHELQPPAGGFVQKMSIIFNKDPEANYGKNEEPGAPRKTSEVIYCNKFISSENQQNNNRREDIKGDILNDEATVLHQNNEYCCNSEINEGSNRTEFYRDHLETKVEDNRNFCEGLDKLVNEDERDILNDETTVLTQNNEDFCNSEINKGNSQTEFYKNRSLTKVENNRNFCEGLETLSNKDGYTRSHTKEAVNTTPSSPNSTNYEKAERSQYGLIEIFSNCNAKAKQAETMDEIEYYSSERNSENSMCPSSEKDVDEKDDSKLEKEEKTDLKKVCHQSTECHPCILENYLESRWSSEENLDKLIDDQCVPEVKGQSKLNGFTFKEPVDENNNIINENISKPLGVIEGFSDIESSCYDEEWVTQLIAEIKKDIVPIKMKEVKTDYLMALENKEYGVESLKNETDFNESECIKMYKKSDDNICECSNVYGCLQVVDSDEEDELLTEEQLQSVETGSVSDWLHTVRPAGCWLFAKDIIDVSPEEIKAIDDEDKNQELDENLIKNLFIHKWLENPSLKYACGDYEAK